MTFVAFLYNTVFIMALVAVKGANQNYAVSIRNDTILSEYRSAAYQRKILTKLKGGITVHADSLYQKTAYCKLWEEFY